MVFPVPMEEIWIIHVENSRQSEGTNKHNSMTKIMVDVYHQCIYSQKSRQCHSVSLAKAYQRVPMCTAKDNCTLPKCCFQVLCHCLEHIEHHCYHYFANLKALKGYACNWLSNSIIAIGQIPTFYCRSVVECLSYVAKEPWCLFPLHCLWIPFCKLFRWNNFPLEGLVHHLFGEYKLVEPVIINLKKTDCLNLIYVNVSKKPSPREQ